MELHLRQLGWPRRERSANCARSGVHTFDSGLRPKLRIRSHRNDLVLGEDGKPGSNKTSYYDRNGFATASKEELDHYIKNIYYVLLTRGILGTHVYVQDPKLRAYFSQFFRKTTEE